jgi:hypothetical protein
MNLSALMKKIPKPQMEEDLSHCYLLLRERAVKRRMRKIKVLRMLQLTKIGM